MRKKKYARGRYILPSDAENSHAIAAFITGLAFLKLSETHRIFTRNRQHRLYSFRLPEIEKDVILKVYGPDPSYSLLRRLTIRVTGFFKDRGKASFFGALALRKSGIHTYRPLACWTYKSSWYDRETYLLYEKILADFAIREYRNELKSKQKDSHHMLDPLIEGMAVTAAHLHRRNMRHGDLAFCNFLVKLPDSPPAQPLEATKTTPRVSTSSIRIGFPPALSAFQCSNAYWTLNPSGRSTWMPMKRKSFSSNTSAAITTGFG